ncbi:MAG: CoA-binding protein [Hyphomicrobium sp.]|nr:CoA-binding protein [Hyphomicrobium sp.]
MTADRNSDEAIDAILSTARVFAVVGASNKPYRPSYGVMKALIEHGYTLHPVNPGLAGQEIHGRRVYASLADVPAPVDVVDIFRNSNDALGVVREAIALRNTLGITVVWMQLGVINAGAAEEASAAGLAAVMDRCPRIELARKSRR